MPERLEVDLCVIGADAAGYALAAGAAQLGLKVALCAAERPAGGLALAALAEAAAAARAVREAGRFGVRLRGATDVDPVAVRAHVRAALAAVAPNGTFARIAGLGVRVIETPGRFAGPDRVLAGDFEISARRFAIATGSRPAIPAISGIETVDPLTEATIFDLDVRPDHLLVVGGGAVGCALAQAHARLGTRVTLVDAGRILPGEDGEAVEIVRRALLADGATLHENTKVLRFERHAVAPVAVLALPDGGDAPIAFSHVLVATGRTANVEDLGLDRAGVAAGPAGIVVDRRLRTTNARILALGEVAGAPAGSHVAGWQAGIAIRNLCFRWPAVADARAIARVVVTDPGIAQVGPTEEALRAAGHSPRAVRWTHADTERAAAAGAGTGFTKLLADAGGRIVSATVVGAQAGELVVPWISAVRRRARLAEISGLAVPSATFAEAGRRAAGAFIAPRLGSPRTRRLVRFLFRLPI
jgi:pyruvate/2-oxoglutarate dehydrogenase complex dihydrolipoamide dehydrogenase (E3) component